MSTIETLTAEATFPACPNRLTEAQIEQFHRDGYLAFTDVLSADEVEQVKSELRGLLDQLRGDHKALTSSHGTVWKRRDGKLTTQFERGQDPTGDDDPDLELKVRKYHDFVWDSEHLHYLAMAHERIQGVLSGLIGAEPILSQNMALVKPPFHGSEKPWHQDDAYFSIVPLEAVCGVWIAIDEAGADNGCMHVLPGAHKLGPLRHYHGQDCEIVPDRLGEGAADVSKAVAIPLPPGGALFFSGVLPHQTPPNQSAERRRALQFHYRSRDSRIVPTEEYDAIFAEADGTAATCAAAARRGF